MKLILKFIVVCIGIGLILYSQHLQRESKSLLKQADDINIEIKKTQYDMTEAKKDYEADAMHKRWLVCGRELAKRLNIKPINERLSRDTYDSEVSQLLQRKDLAVEASNAALTISKVFEPIHIDFDDYQWNAKIESLNNQKNLILGQSKQKMSSIQGFLITGILILTSGLIAFTVK